MQDWESHARMREGATTIFTTRLSTLLSLYSVHWTPNRLVSYNIMIRTVFSLISVKMVKTHIVHHM